MLLCVCITLLYAEDDKVEGREVVKEVEGKVEEEVDLVIEEEVEEEEELEVEEKEVEVEKDMCTPALSPIFSSAPTPNR